MKKNRAFWAGVLGGAVMSLLMAIAATAGLSVNVEMILGTMSGLQPDTGVWVFGFILHLVLSGVIGLAYGYAFEHFSHRAGAVRGLEFSLVHLVIAGFVMMALPYIHPLMPDTIQAPGAFMSNFGSAGVVAFVVLHLVYGSITGAVYGEVSTYSKTGLSGHTSMV